MKLSAGKTSSAEIEARRRSMVGAPPFSTLNAAKVTPKATPRAAAVPTSRKRPVKEENLDESEGSSSEEQSQEEEEEEEKEVEKPRRKKRRTRLTHETAKSKRRAERKALAAERRKEEAANKKDEDDEDDTEEKETTPEAEEPEPEIKTPSLRKYSPLQLFCDHLLRKLMAKDPEEYFAFPVTPSMAPDYASIITNPMDFSTMRQKIEDDVYKNIQEMQVDAELVVNNAMTYNQPNTIYHLAACKLGSLVRFYFGENYLRYSYHTLPFTKDVPPESLGLRPLAPPPAKFVNNRRAAWVDDVKASTLKADANPHHSTRLATRLPQPKTKLAFLDTNEDGATTLNIVGEPGSKKLIDVIGPLDEGTPGLLGPPGENKLTSQTPISYLTYGPFSSFAPQYDSTWATLNKKDSDLLIHAYGDKNTATQVISLRQMVEDSGEHFIRVVDDILDALTEGEHTRCVSALERKKPDTEPDVDTLLNDVETLEAAGLDVSFVDEIRRRRRGELVDGPDERLHRTGRTLAGLWAQQHERLSSSPALSLIRAPSPSALETRLAQSAANQLSEQIADYATPGNLVTAPTLHDAMNVSAPDLDLSIISEFFVSV